MKKPKIRKIRLSDLRRMTAVQTARCVFYAVVAVSAVLFALFRFVGFDTPYDENPDYNAPLLTGTLVGFMLILVAATLALAVWSFVRAARMNRGTGRVVNNIPARRITLGVAGGTAATLLATLAASSGDALTVNGAQFADAFWLRVSGMFIGTSALMIAAAIAAVIFGTTRNRR